jgi:VanZ family protein
MKTQFFKSYWKSIVWAIFILLLCGIPGNEINKVNFIDIPYMDKMVHAFLYFVFTILLISENNSSEQGSSVLLKTILIVSLISLSYGALIEIMQKFIFINRGAEIWDMVANALGVLLAILLFQKVRLITRGYL